jgi:hypothetical protein
MKVLAVVASARRTGNSEILAKEMLAALPESVDKTMLRLADLTVEPCKACYACLPAGKDCVIQDDFESFLQQVRDSDAVIIASPVYFLGMHTRLKLLCDRFISVLNEAEKYTGRRCVVAVPYGIKDWDGYGVEATVNFARFLHLDVVGVLPVHAANPGEAVRPEILAQAREIAGRLLRSSDAVAGTAEIHAPRQAVNPEDIVCGACGSGVVRISGKARVLCAICGTAGKIHASTAAGEPAVQIEWETPEHFRYSVAGMIEHAQKLECVKADFIARRQELSELRKPYK